MRRKGKAIDGVLLLDKAYGESSNAALQTARRIFNAQRQGIPEHLTLWQVACCQ